MENQSNIEIPDNESTATDNQRWMIARVKPRAEKKVEELLNAIALENSKTRGMVVADAVKIKVKRKWSDRTKMVEIPALPGYVFLRFGNGVTPQEKEKLLVKILYTSGLVRLLTKPKCSRFDLAGLEQISTRDIMVFKLLAEEIGNPIELTEEQEAEKIKLNKTVVFRDGLLAEMGVEFKVDDMRHNEPMLYIGEGIFRYAHVRVSKKSIRAVD